MLQIEQYSSTEILVSDSILSKRDKISRNLLNILLLVILSFVICNIYFIFLSSFIIGFQLVPFITLLLFNIAIIVVGIFVSISFYYSLSIPISTNLTFFLNSSKQLENLYTRKAMQYRPEVFIETEVRFNQAVGFRITSDYREKPDSIRAKREKLRDETIYFLQGYCVEIMYHVNTAGIEIFRGWDIKSTAQAVFLLQHFLPNCKTLDFASSEKTTTTGSLEYANYTSMDTEHIDEFNLRLKAQSLENIIQFPNEIS